MSSEPHPRHLLRLAAVLAPALALVTTLAPRPAAACGPDFPVSLLVDRGDTLGTLPEGWFLTEVGFLVKPAHVYPYVAGAGPTPDDAGSRERALYLAGDHAGVLRLPPAQRRHRSTWAAYMIGRDDHSIEAYQQVRALVDAGFEDTAGLAASSLGQEARLHLWNGDTVAAIRLYAEQAAVGHPDGGTSLLFVMRDLIAHDREREILADPIGQRLTATYLETRLAELTDAQAGRLWDELIAIDHLEGADQLAAVAYQRGDWDRATALLARAGDTPRARWVAAKLALRAGDRAAADRLLAEAAAGYQARAACDPADGGAAPAAPAVAAATADDAEAEAADEAEAATDEATDEATADAEAATDADFDSFYAPETEADRIVGERAAVAIIDGDMARALALTWRNRRVHPDDLHHVAERLVTIDELIAFVDALPGADRPTHDHEEWMATPASLRALLGRRLMRVGRFAEAIRYLGPSARGPAIDYAVAMTTARVTLDPIDRAGALYRASRVARRDGLEILGTAHAPDWEFYGAAYDRYTYVEASVLDGRTALELGRMMASAPIHGERYHYRYLAADLAERAADLLPRRSQAFVAALCWSARYIRNDDPDRVQALYRRALRQGPPVSMDFPNDCPEPELDRARAVRPTPSWARPGHHDQPVRRWLRRHHARQWLTGAGAVIGGAALLLLGLALQRRRWRRFAPRP